MTSSQDELSQIYKLLLDEVLDLADSTGKGRTKAGGVPSRTSRLIKNLLAKTAGRDIAITEKTIGNYYRDEYSPNRTLIGYFAAASLVHHYKEIKIEDCKEFFSDDKAVPDYFWNEYIERARKRTPLPELPVYYTETPQWESQGILADPLKVFPAPDYEKIFHRPNTLDRLFMKICQFRLVVLDGMAGCGKKHLIKAIESKLLDSAKYCYIWWIPLHKNYSLNNLFDDLPIEVDPSAKGITGKILWLDDQLKSRRILMVFYDMNQGELDSFLPLFRHALDKPGDCRYLILRDCMSLFQDIPPSNSFAVTPYTNTEIKDFFLMDNILLSREDIPRIANTTGGWPYYLTAVRKNWGNERAREDIFTTRNLHTDLIRWFKLWSIYIGASEIELLQACVFYGSRLRHDEITSLANMLGISGMDAALTLLQQCHLMSRYQGDNYEPTQIAKTYFYFNPTVKTRAKAHETVAAHLEATLTKTRNYKIIEKEIDLRIRVIQQYQQAGNYVKSGILLNDIRYHLKRLNRFPALITLLARQIQKETEKKHWYNYDLAQGYYVTGQYKDCLSVLKQCMQHAFTWYAENSRDADGVSYYIKVFQLFADLCSSSGKNKEAISIFSDVLSLFDYAELNWATRSQSITTLSSFYEKAGDSVKAMEMNNNLLAEHYGHSAIAEGVINMRMAIVYKKLGNHPKKREFLDKASLHFGKGQDKRALAWVHSYIALDHLYNKERQQARYLIAKILKTQCQGDLSNGEYLRWVKFIGIKVKGSYLSKLAASESTRVGHLEGSKGISWQNRLTELIGFVANHLKYHSKIFDIDAFIKPLTGNDIPLNSELSRSIVQRVLNRPLKFLEKIASREPASIFGDLNTCFQIKSCAAIFECQHFLKQEILFRHFNHLADQKVTSDQVRLEYATILFSLKEYEKTLELLTYVTLANQRCTYLLLKADCYRRTKKFADAEGYYDLALLAKSSDLEEAYVRHNQARLVIDCKDTSKFEAALSWSEQALNLNGSDPEFVKNVIDTIVFLNIQLSPHQHVVITMQRLVELYALSESRVESIIQSVEHIPKRDMLLSNRDVFKKN